MIQVYTGNGKGKTSAALGLALRSAGAGLKIYIAQFLKRGSYSEIKALRRFKNIRVEQFGAGVFIRGRPSEKDIACARKGLLRLKQILSRKKGFEVIILDELCLALSLGVLDLSEVKGLLEKIPRNRECVITGRCAPKQILELADLVSSIQEVRHYFKKKVAARRGIEF